MKFAFGFLAATMMLAGHGVANAGGFERGTADTDILYESGKATFRAGATYIQPNRKFDNHPVPGLRGTEYSRPYWVPSVAAKINIIDEFRCAATYTRSFAADSKYSTMSNRGKIEEAFDADEYALTCAYFVPAGPGNLVILGGGFVQTFDYEFSGFTTSPFGGITPLGFGLDDSDIGYRVGLGYEIPEIAFRSQLMYRSGTEHNPDGTARLPQFGIEQPASGIGELPQSLEWKIQSGIAQDWVAFGSVKWTDWSSLKTLDVRIGGSGFQNEYYWRDGWRISGGVGHKFNDTWSGMAQVSWDRGVSTGWDLMGDTYALTAGVTRKDEWGGELRLLGAVFYNDKVEETKYAAGLNASAQGTWGYGLNVQYRLSF